MTTHNVQFTIAVCTRNRRDLLAKCLDSLINQVTTLHYQIVCVENDEERKSYDVVQQATERAKIKGIEVFYICEPIQNISLARNVAVENSIGEFVVFIDDDETAAEDWLEQLYCIQQKTNADVVQGTLIPIFAEGFSDFIKNASMYNHEFFEKECVQVHGASTGTTLYRLSALRKVCPPFDPDFGISGGEDLLLSLYLDANGSTFYKTSLAKIYEFQPLSRGSLWFHLERQFRGEGNHYRAIRKVCGRVRSLMYVIRKYRCFLYVAFTNIISLLIHPKKAFLNELFNLASFLGLSAALLGYKKRGYK